MKHINQLALALAAAVGLSSAALAGTVDTGTSDLILGFRDTSATSVNLEVNLGNVSQFTEAAAGSSFVVSRLDGADLNTVFTSGWNSSTLQFGVIGTTGKAGNGAVGPDGQSLSTIWMSWDGASAPLSKIASLQNTPVTDILKLFTPSQPASLNSVSSSAIILSNPYSAQIDATGLGSWSQSETTTSAFGGPNSLAGFESTGGFSGSVSFDLYELLPVNGSGALVGTFNLTDTGVLSFTSSGLYASAVPEPSTYGLIAGSLILGFVATRRRRRKA